MIEDRLHRLSEGQIDCLRLVLVRASSKEIARDLGISPHTVDQRLRTAMRILGVASRFEAARLLAKQPGGPSYQSLIYQEPHVAQSAGEVERPATSAIGEGWDEQARIDAVREDHVVFMPDLTAAHLARPPFFPRAGERNDLSPAIRLAVIAAIAIGTAIGFGAFLAGLDALARLTAGPS